MHLLGIDDVSLRRGTSRRLPNEKAAFEFDRKESSRGYSLKLAVNSNALVGPSQQRGVGLAGHGRPEKLTQRDDMLSS